MSEQSARHNVKSFRKPLCIACLFALAIACAALLYTHSLPGAFSSTQCISTLGTAHGQPEAIICPQGTVDVNTADAETLTQLYGVGPALAQAIVDDRTANGSFDFPQDLLMVKGIGSKTLAGFLHQLYFPLQTPVP